VDPSRFTNSGLSYDAAGNLLTDGTGAGTFTYTYDAEGRVKTATPYGGSTATYTYNALGQRVRREVSTSVVDVGYDAFGQMIGFASAGSWFQLHVPLAGRTIAKYAGAGSPYFMHPNHLGSTTAVTNQTGNLITMRSVMDRFTLDHHRPPESLEELVTTGYLRRTPTEPFTGTNETWQVDTR
jgi:YD repeat-containing protein